MDLTFKTLLFVYGIVFVLICMLTTSISICSYLVSHRRIHLFTAAFFFFDMLESSLVFLDEYLGNKAAIDFAAMDFPMTHPLLKLLLSCGVLASVWALTLEMTDRFNERSFTVPVVLFALGEGLALMIPSHNFQQLAFYALRSFAMIGAIVFIASVATGTQDKGLKSYLEGCRRMLVIFAMLVLMVLLEDAIHLAGPAFGLPLLSQAGFLAGIDWVYFAAGRNVSENLMTMYASYLAIKSGAEVLSMRFDEPPTTEMTTAKHHADMRFERFCEVREISAREGDVLRLMLEGKNNRVIAEELFISQGTVKAHVHSIYKKCGTNDRKSLLQMFWAD